VSGRDVIWEPHGWWFGVIVGAGGAWGYADSASLGMAPRPKARGQPTDVQRTERAMSWDRSIGGQAVSGRPVKPFRVLARWHLASRCPFTRWLGPANRGDAPSKSSHAA